MVTNFFFMVDHLFSMTNSWPISEVKKLMVIFRRLHFYTTISLEPKAIVYGQKPIYKLNGLHIEWAIKWFNTKCNRNGAKIECLPIAMNVNVHVHQVNQRFPPKIVFNSWANTIQYNTQSLTIFIGGSYSESPSFVNENFHYGHSPSTRGVVDGWFPKK